LNQFEFFKNQFSYFFLIKIEKKNPGLIYRKL
jgi:hypothetical protein